jgi:hypothetical protein
LKAAHSPFSGVGSEGTDIISCRCKVYFHKIIFWTYVTVRLTREIIKIKMYKLIETEFYD